jgi:hypothetical protein
MSAAASRSAVLDAFVMRAFTAIRLRFSINTWNSEEISGNMIFIFGILKQLQPQSRPVLQ